MLRYGVLVGCVLVLGGCAQMAPDGKSRCRCAGGEGYGSGVGERRRYEGRGQVRGDLCR